MSWKEVGRKNVYLPVLSMVKWLLILAVSAYLLVTFVVQRADVYGNSMEPVLTEGDVVLVDKLAPRLGRLDRFDMVVFRYRYRENRYYIKRIIALPGETVQISNGKILINGEVLEEPYGIERIEKAKRAEGPVVLGEDEYFVLGDNRNHSSDSRDSDIGNLARDEIIGRVMIRIWPWSKIGTFPANESCDGAE